MGTLLLFAFIAALALAERIPRLRRAPLRLVRRFVGTDLVYLCTGALGLGLIARTATARIVADSGPAFETLRAWPFGLTYAAGLVLYDLSAYLTHALLLHRVSALWRVHCVHHSSRELDWLAAFRAHVAEHVLRHLTSACVLVAIGFPAAVVGAVAATYAAWAALGHSNLDLRLGALEGILITPRLHRLHHAVATCDANFGTIFSLWDRLGGTWAPNGAADPIGVPGELEVYPQTWGRQLIEPFRRTPEATVAGVSREGEPPGR